MALEAYYREMAKLQQSGGSLTNFPNFPGLIALQQQAVLNGAQDLSVKKEQQQLQQELQQQAQQQQQPIKMNGQHSSLNIDEVTTKLDKAYTLYVSSYEYEIHSTESYSVKRSMNRSMLFLSH